MAAACKAAGGLPGCYELTVGHPDKGQLPLAEVQRRLQPFLDDGTPIIVTQVGRPCNWHGQSGRQQPSTADLESTVV